ncbi:MAG TPA: hypothetical protein VK988_04490 [Acidimicrobiales bacterium]|nr:hypothetical protein [Acidimicrobiales bacterium]
MTDPAIRYFEEAIRRAETAREELDIEVKGLRLALSRLQRNRDQPEEQRPAELAEDESVSAEVKAWRALSRTDAVERVLVEGGGELHRKEIARRLADVGRDDRLDAISAALAYMARGDAPRVEGLGYGRWRLRKDPPTPTPPAPDDDAAPPRSWPGPLNGSAGNPVEEVASTSG